MIKDLAYLPIFGVPAVAYGGLATLILLLLTAYVGHSIFSGKTKYSIKAHYWLARITILFAVIHAFFASSAFLKF